MESIVIKILDMITDSWLYYLATEAMLLYLAGQLICCIGLYTIFSKITQKRRLAFIPGTNCARLGELFNRKLAGFLVGLSQILLLPVAGYIDDFFSYPNDSALVLPVMVVVVVERHGPAFGHAVSIAGI